MRHKPSRKPSSLVYSVFPNKKSFSFFLISVKMDLENKGIGFQFEPEKSISNHKGFFQDTSDEGDAMERGRFDRKDYDPSVWCKCRNCSTTKTEKECLCCQEVEGVRRGFGVFVLSQAIILSKLQKQSRRGVLRNFAMNYLKFLRTSFPTEHLRSLLLELTHNLMISISICFRNQSWFQNPCHTFQTSKNSQENTCAGVLINMRLQKLQRRCFPVNFAKFL